MALKTPRATTLFESVRWGTAKQVQDILNHRDLTFDDKWTDYALLMTALRRKHKEIVKLLLNKGCRTQKIPRNDTSDTPLFYAIKIGDVEIVKMLLDKSASINDVDQNGETPLCLAMKKGHHKIVDLILSGNNVTDINSTNNDGLSHFHIACMRNKTNVVKNFLKNGVDVNHSVNNSEAKEWSGYTSLHFAVYYECLNTIKVLLINNADITLKNGENMTPLHLAVQKKNDIIVDLILSSHVNKICNPVDNNGFSHFHIACMKYHLEAVKKFLQHGVEINQAVNLNSPVWPGYTPLHFAVRGLSIGSTATVECLLLHKANVNAKDVEGQTPLHLACLQSDKKFSKLIQNVISSLKNTEINESNFSNQLCKIVTEQVKIIELLIKYKSDINLKNIYDETPLFYLYKGDRSKIINKEKCEKQLLNKAINVFNVKRKEILKILIDSNANINVHNDTGQTILHLIASVNKKFNDDEKEEVAELIINKGADVNAKTKFGFTPLHIAAKNGHSELIELFLKHNANVNSSENPDQSTPLHLATSYQQVKAIDMLIKYEADVTLTNKSNGMNVLHIMALMNPESSNEPEFIENYQKIIETFLEHDCDINAQDFNGRTPLHLASWDLNNAATWALLHYFADVNVEDYAGETPLSFPLNFTPSSINIYCMFRDYLHMLKLTGLPISDKTETCYLKLYEKDPVISKDEFPLECTEEIEKMKNTKINNYCSLYDIVFKNSSEMEVYASNEQFERIIKSVDFDKDFHIYSSFLKSQYRKGLRRKALLKSAKDSLEFITEFRFPDSCSEKIFQHLGDKSLKNLIKAKTITISNNKIIEQQTVNHQNECTSLEKMISYYKHLFNKQIEM